MEVNATRGRAIIIRASLAGLFAATLLRKAGWHTDVFERSHVELVGPAQRNMVRHPPSRRKHHLAPSPHPTRSDPPMVTTNGRHRRGDLGQPNHRRSAGKNLHIRAGRRDHPPPARTAGKQEMSQPASSGARTQPGNDGCLALQHSGPDG